MRKPGFNRLSEQILNESADMKCVSNGEEKVKLRIDSLEILVHSMWLLLKDSGFTDEMLNSKISQVLEENKKAGYLKLNIECEDCHQPMQSSGDYTAKCIYCGKEIRINPFQSEYFEPMPVSEETDVNSEATDEESQESNFEVYDVDKDLKFDTEE